MSFGPRGLDLAQFNIICFLPVIMTKKTGKPRGRPRKTEDVDDGRKKKRERDRRHYQRKKGVQGDEEEENEREGQGAAGATFDGSIRLHLILKTIK